MRYAFTLLALTLLSACGEQQATYQYRPEDKTYEVQYTFRTWFTEPGSVYPAMDAQSRKLCPKGYETVANSQIPRTDIVGDKTTNVWTIHCN